MVFHTFSQMKKKKKKSPIHMHQNWALHHHSFLSSSSSSSSKKSFGFVMMSSQLSIFSWNVSSYFPFGNSWIIHAYEGKKKKRVRYHFGQCRWLREVFFFFSSRTPIKNLILKVHLCERKYSSKKVEYEFFCEKKYYNKKFKLL